MDKFINRDVQYPNRKKLIVKNLEYDDSGDIKKLLVDVERNEGTIFEEGTPLTAELLNGILGEYETRINDIFKTYYSVGNLTYDWFHEENNKKSVNVSIETIEKLKVMVTSKAPEFIAISNLVIEDKCITFKVNETDYLNQYSGFGTDKFEFEIELRTIFSDVLVAKLVGIINYTYPPSEIFD